MSPKTNTPAAEAARLQRAAARHPEDRESLLLEAAGLWESAGEHAKATSIYDELLAAGTDDTHFVKALKASALWEYGHEAEARAIIDGIIAARPAELAPWEVIGELLETHDDLPAAESCFSTGAGLLSDGDDISYDAEQLLIGRHRVRRLRAEPHDELDEAADRRHDARPGATPLDELHDPNRTWSLGSNDPEELRAEIARLKAEVAERRSALSRPFRLSVLHWPKPEFDELLERFPAVAAEYGTHEEHLRQVERDVRELSASGAPHVGVVSGTVPSYEAYAVSEGTSPDTPTLLAEYATDLAARGRAASWPPPRNAPCWCGSGRKYKKCCGSPDRV